MHFLILINETKNSCDFFFDEKITFFFFFFFFFCKMCKLTDQPYAPVCSEKQSSKSGHDSSVFPKKHCLHISGPIKTK